jgi:guanylate kinase
MADKVYCGNGKVIKTQYGDMMKLSLSPEDIEKIVERSKATKDRGGWVNIDVKERREPSPKGMTHYLEIDMWEPNSDGESSAKNTKSVPNEDEIQLDEEITAEDLPF